MEQVFRRQDRSIDSNHTRKSKEQYASHLPDNISFCERIKHFTWAWFTLPMSTGGIALLLNSTPYQFRGLDIIGRIIFVFDIALFLAIVAAITTRFVIAPGSLQRSLRHPTEALFFPTAWLALVNILSCAQVYGVPRSGPWLVVALRVLFWIYVPTTFLVSVAMYWYLFTAPPKRLTIQSMTPGWILPVFPVMIAGVYATILSPDQPPVQRMAILIAGVTCQGLGWMVSFLMYASFIQRLMQFGLPSPNLRPGMFIAVGPPSFTALAVIGLCKALPPNFEYFATRPLAIPILQTLADFVAIFLWGLAFFFFCIAAVSVVSGYRRMTFHLVWWSLVFPNVGFAIATSSIGKQLESEGILWVASGMTILLVGMWAVVLVAHMRAVLLRKIMMPGLDEDKDEYREDDKKHNIHTPD